MELIDAAALPSLNAKGLPAAGFAGSPLSPDTRAARLRYEPDMGCILALFLCTTQRCSKLFEHQHNHLIAWDVSTRECQKQSVTGREEIGITGEDFLPDMGSRDNMQVQISLRLTGE